MWYCWMFVIAFSKKIHYNWICGIWFYDFLEDAKQSKLIFKLILQMSTVHFCKNEPTCRRFHRFISPASWNLNCTSHIKIFNRKIILTAIDGLCLAFCILLYLRLIGAIEMRLTCINSSKLSCSVFPNVVFLYSWYDIVNSSWFFVISICDTFFKEMNAETFLICQIVSIYFLWRIWQNRPLNVKSMKSAFNDFDVKPFYALFKWARTIYLYYQVANLHKNWVCNKGNNGMSGMSPSAP